MEGSGMDDDDEGMDEEYGEEDEDQWLWLTE